MRWARETPNSLESPCRKVVLPEALGPTTHVISPETGAVMGFGPKAAEAGEGDSLKAHENNPIENASGSGDPRGSAGERRGQNTSAV